MRRIQGHQFSKFSTRFRQGCAADVADSMGGKADVLLGVFGRIEQIIDSARPAVELLMTARVMPQMLHRIELRRVTMRTSDPFRASPFSHPFKALLIVDQRQERQFHPWFLVSNLQRDSRGSLPRGHFNFFRLS
jgi:hypothetical protein